MTKKIQPSGLCMNCSNLDECSYSVNHTKSVIFCEEFTCTDPSEPRGNINRAIKMVDYTEPALGFLSTFLVVSQPDIFHKNTLFKQSDGDEPGTCCKH